MSLIEDIHTITDATAQNLHGESVVLYDSAGAPLVTISNAIVTVEAPIVGGISAGPAEHSGLLRLAATHRPNALQAFTALVQGHTWHVLSVGNVFGDLFRVEIARNEYQHSNEFDLDEGQAVWSHL